MKKASSAACQGAGKLVRTGCRPAIAAHTLQALYHVIAFHSLDQAHYALEISVAAAVKSGGYYAVVIVNDQIKTVGASANAIIMNLFHNQ